MLIDNAAGLQYLFTDDIYLLKQDRDKFEELPKRIDTLVTDAPVVAVDVPVVAPIEQVPVITVAEQLAKQPPAVAEPAPVYFNYLGGNAKQFLILCSYAGGQMDEKHLAALTSSLNRKELVMDDVVLLNIAKHKPTVSQIMDYFKPTRVLLLGTPCLLPGWDQLAFNHLESLGGITALYTYSFTEMMGDRDKTKAFWEKMKVL